MPDDLSGLAEEIHKELTGENAGIVDGALGGDPLRPWSDWCGAAQSVRKPSVRCRLFGCKPIPDTTLEYGIISSCDCDKTIFTLYDGTMFGHEVHEGCCIRCGQPIIPRATARKG